MIPNETLYDNVDRLFPEEGWVRKDNHWESPYDLQGRKHRRRDKTVITERVPFIILENGSDHRTQSVISHWKDRTGQEYKDLCSHLGVPMPRQYETEAWREMEFKKTIKAHLCAYFQSCLFSSNGKATREYIQNRGFGEGDMKTLCFGHNPGDPQAITQYLTARGMDCQAGWVKKEIDAIHYTTHELVIPYLSCGEIKGFAFRTIKDHKPKYLYSRGSGWRSNSLYGLPNRPASHRLIITEGLLDTAQAQARGIDNISSTGGLGLSEGQIGQAQRKGFKTYFLCFDHDGDGQEDRLQQTYTKATQQLAACGITDIYLSTLPSRDGHKQDVDSYLREHDVQTFEKLISSSTSHWKWRYQQLESKYQILAQQNKEAKLTDPQVSEFLEDYTELSESLPPSPRAQLHHLFLQLDLAKTYGINHNVLEAEVEKRQQKSLAKKSECRSGKNFGENHRLSNRDRELGNTQEDVEQTLSFVPLEELMDKETDSEIQTSFILEFNQEKRPLSFHKKALSILAGATGHGKTMLLTNVMWDVANKHPQCKFLYLSLEESTDQISKRFLELHLRDDFGTHRASSLFKEDLSCFFADKKKLSSKALQVLEKGVKEYEEKYHNTERIVVRDVSWNIEELCTALHSVSKDKAYAGVFIDYLQLVNVPNSMRKNSRQEELKAICIELKDLVKETGLAVITGCQFNRQVVKIGDLHATNIGEAGDIERIASLIVGLWNTNIPSLQNRETRTKSKNMKDVMYFGHELEPCLMYLKVLKNRFDMGNLEGFFALNEKTRYINKSNQVSRILDSLKKSLGGDDREGAETDLGTVGIISPKRINLRVP